MRAFITVRQLMLNPPINSAAKLQTEIKELKKYMDEVFNRPERDKRRYTHPT